MAGKPGRRGWGYVGRMRSGRYQASYRGPDCVRHYAPHTFAAKLDAEGWLASERRAIELGTWQPPALALAQEKATMVTVGQYAAEWVEQRNLKPRTRSLYEGLLRYTIAPTLGTVPVRHLTPDAVRRWYAGLDPDKTRRNSHAYGLLHAIAATAVTDGLLASNPCVIKRAMNTSRKRQPVVLSVAEMGRLADAVPERFKALVLLAAWCGLRWGEVTELRRDDIGAGCEVVSVSRAVTRRDGLTRVDSTKSGEARTVVVPPHVRPVLKHHLDVHTKPDGDSLLFPNSKGAHLNDRVFAESAYRPALKAIGREGVRVHDLRHFAGTQTARVANLVETMQRLGHSTAKASLQYQQQVSGRDAEIAAALSQLAEAEECAE